MMNNIDPKILELLQSQMGNEPQPTEAQMIPQAEQDMSEDSMYSKEVTDVRNSPEYQAKMLDQKQKIAEFKAAQSQAPMEAQAAPAPQAPAEAQAPSQDPRLSAALEQQSKQRRYSDLLRGFQQMVAAGGGIRPDYSMADIMNQRADEPVSQYKQQVAQEAAAKKDAREQKESDLRMDETQLRLKKSNLDFTDMEANRDPNSPQSKIAQDRVLEVRAKMGQPLNEASVRQQSGESLFKTFDFLKQDLAQHYQNVNNEAGRQQQDRMQNKSIAADKEKFEMQQKIKVAEKEEDSKRDETKVAEKEQVQIRKEDRKLRGELGKAETTLEANLNALKEYKKRFIDYSKKSIGGTGPVSTLGGLTKYASSDTQQLEADFNKIGLDEMVKMFQGMSKAVDSDAERRAFTSTQPSLTNDDKVNETIFNEKIAAAESLLKKTKTAKNKFDKTESFDDQTNNQKTVVKKGYNAKTKQTQLIYSDGSKEIVEGQQ